VRAELVEDRGLRVADRVLGRLFRHPMVRRQGGERLLLLLLSEEIVAAEIVAEIGAIAFCPS
jgi:hypothetical protein